MTIPRNVCVSFVAALALTISAHAASSPTGTWSVSSNGTAGIMAILVNNGHVTGYFLGDQIEGFWDSSTGRLLFYRAGGGTTSSTPPASIQIYTGYLIEISPASNQLVLTGHFEAFSAGGGTETRNVFGWYGFRAFSSYCPSWPKTTCPVV
jgi:hypothetical protein